MKKLLKKSLIAIMLIMLLFTFVSCTAAKEYTVTFNLGDGREPICATVLRGDVNYTPDTPEREGFVFGGWYENSACTVPFNFSTPIWSNKSAYALWLPDAVGFGNLIATEGLTSTVKIHFEQFDFLGSGTLSLGSGVIYRLSDGYYYCLTNEHVVRCNSTPWRVNYRVYDAFGNEYTAELVGKADSQYDLAVLKFKKNVSNTEQELSVATLAERDAKVGELLASVGNPGGLVNTVTYGECTEYAKVTVEGGSGVTFPVGVHSAPLDSGSSGGGVFNVGLELIGINFAAKDNVSAFIQITKVREFLSQDPEFLG